jgi:hypothetical protein
LDKLNPAELVVEKNMCERANVSDPIREQLTAEEWAALEEPDSAIQGGIPQHTLTGFKSLCLIGASPLLQLRLLQHQR